MEAGLPRQAEVGTDRLTGGDDAAALAAAMATAMEAHQAGDLATADAAYADVLAAAPGHARALRLRGILKRETGDLPASATLLRRAAAASPQPAEALAELALTHLAAGDLELAETALRQARSRGPHPRALANLGAVLQYRGHLAEAEALYREYLAAEPADSEIRANLVTTLLDAGRGEPALAECAAGEQAAPGDPAMTAARGAALVALERPGEALPPLRRALAALPGDDVVAINLAVALAETGAVGEAQAVLAAAIDRNPANARAVADLMSLRAGEGDAAAAVALGRAFLGRHPGERLVVAALGYALWDAGDDAAAGRLLGFGADGGALVQVYSPGDLAATDSPVDPVAIARRVAADPSLVRAPVSKATRGGAQTGEFYLPREAVLAPLDARFRAAVAAYVARLATAGLARDPVMQGAPGAPGAGSLRAWGTVLPAGGRQVPHQHPLGWLSAVYYAAIPPAMRAAPTAADAGTPGPRESAVGPAVGRATDPVASPAANPATDPDAGALEFGPAPPRYRFRRPVPVTRIRPVTGALVVFPSYLYHGTRPFAGAGERVSVAVDFPARY